MFKMRKIPRIDLFWIMKMMRSKRWRSWKVIPVEVSPLLIIPQSIKTNVWRLHGKTVLEETFFWLHANFRFPPWHFQNMMSMWFCGDIPKIISPYRMLGCKDVKQVKGVKQKLSNMKTLVKHVMRAAVISNWNDLVVNWCYPRKAMELYENVIYFPCLTYEKIRHY